MTTVLDIVNRAFRKIGVKAEDEQLTADQLAYGVETLGAMLQGLTLSDSTITLPTITATYPFPMEAKYEEAVMMMLAARLAQDYERPMFDASHYERLVMAGLLTLNPSRMPLALTRTPSQRRWWN